MNPAGDPVISVVVPTHARREVVTASLEGFRQQTTTSPFEVLVVVDGDPDGTAAALRSQAWPFLLRVIEQANAGASAARNAGAAQARAPVLLFLDDDMEPAPGALEAHLAAHRGGADAVVGAMPLHPNSPATFPARDVGRWADKMAERCSAPGYAMTADDVFTGHLSVGKQLFDELGGFSRRFTADGTFGNEDVDLAQRLISAGARVEFRSDAVARQRYVVTASQQMRRAEELGAADMALLRAHPELDDTARVAALRHAPDGIVGRVVLRAPRLVPWLVRPLEHVVGALVDRGASNLTMRRAFKGLHDVRYWKGVWSAGGPLDGTQARALCWHALQDLSDDPILRPYGVPPHVLAEQLSTLTAAGWAALSPTEFECLIREGRPVPRRSFMVTFDDCYAELATEGRRVVTRARVPAAAFVVTGRVGQANLWDRALGVRQLPLASWEQLTPLIDQGFELGGHSRTHQKLTSLGDEELKDEVSGAAADLAARGLAPRLFAYPHGAHDARVEAAAAAAGFMLGLTVTPGNASSGCDPYRVPRSEVFPHDRGRLLRRKVALGGRWGFLSAPWGVRRALAMAFARRLRRRITRRVTHYLSPKG